MTAAAILSELEALGVQVESRDGKLRLSPAGLIGPAMIEVIRAHKAEIITALQATAPCGSPYCKGCYEVEPGVRIHPPRTGQGYLDWLLKWQPKGKVQ